MAYFCGRQTNIVCFLLGIVLICSFGVNTYFLKKDIPYHSMVMPAIIWDPRNPVFNCPSRGINTINVRQNDYLPFGCPSAGTILGWHIQIVPYIHLYENAFFTEDEHQAKTCNATGIANYLLRCNTPLDTVTFRIIRAARQSGNDEDPKFNYNRTYYVFGTGNGDIHGIDNRVGGRCKGENPGDNWVYNMTLRIRTCPKGEAGTKSCPICKTAACYNYGCGNYGNWTDPSFFRNISNIQEEAKKSVRSEPVRKSEPTCFKVRTRICDDIVAGCEGEAEEKVAVPCPTVTVSQEYENCSVWVNLTNDIYYNSNGSCFIRSHRSCFFGSLEKHNLTQWRLIQRVCPSTTAPPKIPSTTPSFCPWQNFSGIWKNSTNHCFSLQQRKCEGCKRNVTEMRFLPVQCPSEPSLSTSIPSTSVTLSASTTQGSTKPDSTGATGSMKPDSTGATGSARQSGEDASKDFKSYVIPIATAIFGCFCGAAAVWFYMLMKQKDASRVYVDGDASDTESKLTMDTDGCSGAKNIGYRMSTLKRTAEA